MIGWSTAMTGNAGTDRSVDRRRFAIGSMRSAAHQLGAVGLDLLRDYDRGSSSASSDPRRHRTIPIRLEDPRAVHLECIGSAAVIPGTRIT